MSTVPVFEPLINSEDAADLLGIHRLTVIKLAKEGKIPAARVGKLWRFRVSALNSWLQDSFNI